jgi:hypothetical protein
MSKRIFPMLKHAMLRRLVIAAALLFVGALATPQTPAPANAAAILSSPTRSHYDPSTVMVVAKARDSFRRGL